MARDPEYQRKYYAANRERRLAESIAYGREHRERRAEYMAEYYRAKPGKFKRTPEQQRAVNARRREQYASDPAVREKLVAAAKQWGAANPDKRLTQRMRRYGLTAADYHRMLAQQGGGCAICARADAGGRPGARFHVDHCHRTGRVRGLLCSNCNTGIGKFADDPGRLERAALYLRTPNGATSSDL